MVVGTHDGTFHADDVMATAILKLYKYRNIQVVRSREPEVLDKCNIVYDVGGGRFDHHGKTLKLRPSGFPYASAGLIWEFVGEQLIHQYNTELPKQQVYYIKQKIDSIVMTEIDLIDNGANISKNAVKLQGKESKYISNTFSSMVKYLNPTLPEMQDAAFASAVDNIAVPYLDAVLRREINKLSIREKIKSALRDIEGNSKDIDAAKGNALKHVLNIGNIESDWQEALIELDRDKSITFVVFFSAKSNQWRLQAVPISEGSFKCRKYLPAAWAAASPEMLNKLVGITDAVFCHPSRFIAGANSLDSILKMAIKAYTHKRAKSN